MTTKRIDIKAIDLRVGCLYEDLFVDQIYLVTNIEPTETFTWVKWINLKYSIKIETMLFPDQLMALRLIA
jgi:hypothetical protein